MVCVRNVASRGPQCSWGDQTSTKALLLSIEIAKVYNCECFHLSSPVCYGGGGCGGSLPWVSDNTSLSRTRTASTFPRATSSRQIKDAAATVSPLRSASTIERPISKVWIYSRVSKVFVQGLCSSANPISQKAQCGL
jgi:hypothetical protein